MRVLLSFPFAPLQYTTVPFNEDVTVNDRFDIRGVGEYTVKGLSGMCGTAVQFRVVP